MKRDVASSGPWTIHLCNDPVRTKAAWYRWEFLRRNVEFQEEYEGFIRRFKKFFDRCGFWYSDAAAGWKKRDMDYFLSTVLPELNALCDRWEIADLYPPSWRFGRKSGQRNFD
jgi:hypothetical protein